MSCLNNSVHMSTKTSWSLRTFEQISWNSRKITNICIKNAHNIKQENTWSNTRCSMKCFKSISTCHLRTQIVSAWDPFRVREPQSGQSSDGRNNSAAKKVETKNFYKTGLFSNGTFELCVLSEFSGATSIFKLGVLNTHTHTHTVQCSRDSWDFPIS